MERMEQLQSGQFSNWIQSLIDERDQALATNRELETWFEDACLTVKHLADQLIVGDKERDELIILARQWQQLVQDADGETFVSLDDYHVWDERWMKLVEQTDTLTGGKQ